ncbi:MAG: hypothetical protein HFI39_09770 [Lachnospiraceae bacterium]|nr:hypothetical protein [Lachnospiraceae bacterium]
MAIVKTRYQKGRDGCMSELLLKIYEQIVSEESDTYEGKRRIEEYVEELFQKYAADFKQEKAEEIKTLVYAATLKAEQEGFRLGVRFVTRLLLDL